MRFRRAITFPKIQVAHLPVSAAAAAAHRPPPAHRLLVAASAGGSPSRRAVPAAHVAVG